jgi:hypothetical protein
MTAVLILLLAENNFTLRLSPDAPNIIHSSINNTIDPFLQVIVLLVNLFLLIPGLFHVPNAP